MSSQVDRVWSTVLLIWYRELLALERCKVVIPFEFRFVRDDDSIVVADCEPPTIERPVMEFTKCESVSDVIPTVFTPWIDGVQPRLRTFPHGCKGIREYIKASDLKHWIRRQKPGTSETYAKKLVSRTIDALLDLSKNRLAIRRKRERKNGLEYTERRLVLAADAEIPGETAATATTSPVTADVSG